MKDAQLWCELGLGAAALTGCAGGIRKVNLNSPQRPNIVLIVADDLGYGDLSCYGMTRIQTPNVDALARNGLLFTDAHAVASTSTPSRYSLFTGHYSWRRSDTGIAPGNAGMIIRPEQETMADMLKRAGYTTGAIGKWHLGLGDQTGTQDWNAEVTPGPRDIGFDYSYLMAATGDRVPCVWMDNQRVANYDASAPIYISYQTPFEGEPLGKDHPELLTKLKPSPNHGHDQAIVNGISRIGYMKGGGAALWEDEHIADTLTARAVEFIRNRRDTTFFLYVGTNDVHVPRFPKETFRGKSGMGYRGDAILQFDWTVGQIVSTLRDEGLLENTLLILTSDNGPVVDDGYADQAVELLGDHRPWGDFRGGKYSSFEAGTRVPLIVHWPRSVKSGRKTAALFSHIDLFASLARLVKGSAPSTKQLPTDAAPDSRDNLRALLGLDKHGRDYVIEASPWTLSVTDGTWHYIQPSKGPALNRLTNTELGNTLDEQLYNLHDDVGEQHNLAPNQTNMVSELKAILEQEKSLGYIL